MSIYWRVKNNEVLVDSNEAYTKALWTPAAMDTAVWFDASDTNTITEVGGAVSQWDDKSGNNNHTTQFSGGPQLQTGTRTINNLNTLEADGSDWMNLTSGLDSTTDDVFGMITVIEYDKANDNYLISVNSSNVRYGRVSNQWRHRWLDGGLQYMSAGTAVSPPEIVIDCAYGTSGVEYVARKNGTQVGTETPVGANTQVFNQVPGQYASVGIDGAIGEIVMWKASSVDITNVQKLEGYLAWKWNLVGNLPSGHPYKNERPFV